jgi:cytochrome d ubiquinol oxidase subunit II
VTEVDLTLGVLLLGLVAYAVLGGADFGAGFWDLTAGGAEAGSRLRGQIKRAMGPVWEANHVWLIFVLVVLWTGFPDAFGSIMSTLYVPLFLAAVGIVFRGAAFALRGEAATIAEARALGAAFALSSVIVPFFLGTVVGAVASGRVPALPATGDSLTSWTNSTSVFIGVMAVVMCAYLSAVYLAADSQRAGLGDLVAAFKSRALGAAFVGGAVAIYGIFVLRDDARPLYDGLTSGWGVVFVAGSGVAGLLTLWLLWRERFGTARWASAAAVAAIVVGWVVAQSPDILPGALTAEEAAAGDATLIPLLICVVIAVLVLVPALGWLFKLKLTGQLEPEFHPITAGLRDAPGAEADER